MEFRFAGGFDRTAAALIGVGASLLAAAAAAAVVFLAPAASGQSTPQPPAATPVVQGIRPSAVLPTDRIATILFIDGAAGASLATRSGDRVDILAYYSRQITGTENMTRTLLTDVPVLTADRVGGIVALTLALPQSDAVLLQEAQALGARPFVTLLSADARPGTPPAAFADSDLRSRLIGGD